MENEGKIKLKKRKGKPRPTRRPTHEDIKKYCIKNSIFSEDSLKESSFEYWYELVKNCWSRENFWDTVKVMLGKKLLPPDYNPATCRMYLSISDLESLGIKMPDHVAKRPKN